MLHFPKVNTVRLLFLYLESSKVNAVSQANQLFTVELFITLWQNYKSQTMIQNNLQVRTTKPDKIIEYRTKRQVMFFFLRALSRLEWVRS